MRFAASTFVLPPVRIHFHHDEELCRGNRGQVETDADGTPSVHVCAHHRSPDIQRAWRHRTLLHELAHVWVNANADAEARDEFMRLRGVDNWLDPDQPWGERGIEHSAEVFMWGLVGCKYEPDFRIDGTGQAELASAFEVLSGVSAPCRYPD